eukprot:5633260-Pleurochrysis_carterae.AAC.1
MEPKRLVAVELQESSATWRIEEYSTYKREQPARGAAGLLSSNAVVASGSSTHQRQFHAVGRHGRGNTLRPGRSLRMAAAGNVHANSTFIATANGTTGPKYRCQIDLPLRADRGAGITLRLNNVLVLGNASHNLVSLEWLATEAQVELRGLHDSLRIALISPSVPSL